MSDVLVVGGGFAGVWSAAAVVRQRRDAGTPESELRVTLVSAGDDLVIRPRLYEADPEKMRLSLDRILGPIGVRRVAATVTAVDTGNREVTAVRRDGSTEVLSYDRLVLASGSQVVRPDLPGAEHLFNVDTMAGAAGLDAHLHRLSARPAESGRFTAVVIGAGFTGLEIATELTERLRAAAGPDAPVRVVLVERADVVGPELGAGPRPQILEALDELGIEQRLGVTLEAVKPGGVRLSDGTEIEAATTVWTAGMLASLLTAQIPGTRDRLGRLVVDEFLRVAGAPEVYAAGDTAAATVEEEHVVVQSCQYAMPLGRYAGFNVAADLLGLDQVPFAPNPYGMCLDLGPGGAVVTSGWNREVQFTRQDAKNIKQAINTIAIVPPVDDPAKLLEQAHYATRPTLE
jgi:NADH dehydrogenase